MGAGVLGQYNIFEALAPVALHTPSAPLSLLNSVTSDSQSSLFKWPNSVNVPLAHLRNLYISESPEKHSSGVPENEIKN